jgi:hypothetical protein
VRSGQKSVFGLEGSSKRMHCVSMVYLIIPRDISYTVIVGTMVGVWGLVVSKMFVLCYRI